MRSGIKTYKGTGWQGWFAWRPVRASIDDLRYCWVWWEHIERVFAVIGPDGGWQYRIASTKNEEPQ